MDTWVQFRLLDANRALLAIPDPLKWQYTRVVNQPGGFRLDLDPDTPRELVAGAQYVDVWRWAGAGLSPSREGEYLVRKRGRARQADGRRVWRLAGPGALHLLKARIVNAPKDTPMGSKTGAVTDLMRAFLREQLTRQAGDDRTFPFPLVVSGDTGRGPIIGKDAPRAYVLDTLQALAKSALEAGTYVAFDLARYGDGYLFAVYLGQRGADRGRAARVPEVLLADVDLVDWEWEYDAEKEVTAVYVGGEGDGATRPVQLVTEPTRVRLPAGNRWEAWADLSTTRDTAKLTAEGNRKLREGVPLDRLRGTLAPGLYGVRVQWGDRVVIQQETRLWEARLEAVSVNGEGGKEKVEVKLDTIGVYDA